MSNKSFSNFSFISGKSYRSYRTSASHRLPPLHYLCNRANNPERWENVRQWFQEHSLDEAREAAVLQSDFDGTTPLHLACKNSPPHDVVLTFLRLCSISFEHADSSGRLPLHYACHYGASFQVLKELTTVFPNAISNVDTKGRLPLHFAAGNTTKEISPSILIKLTDCGAAAVSDVKGMLPLHYACAYGASEQTLKVLTDAFIGSITTKDNSGFTPLHYVFSNCELPASPIALNFFLTKNPDLVNFYVERNQHPLRVLTKRAGSFDQDMPKEGRDNTKKCLNLYLNRYPKGTPEFLTALQALPKWLLDQAVVHPTVQELLNESVSKPFPTAIILADFYFYVLIITTYFIAARDSIDNSDEDDNASISSWNLVGVYLGAGYFTLREVLQIFSFISLKLFIVWIKEMKNWKDLLFIFAVFFGGIAFDTGGFRLNHIRFVAVVTLFILWFQFLNFLRNVNIEFAIFVSGVIHVVQQLWTFLIILLSIVIAFTQMFYTLFLEPGCCDHQDEAESCDLVDAPDGFHTIWQACFTVYTMLLGEVGDFETKNRVGIFLFCFFVLLVVILLTNFLIAIVTDAYGVIRNERANIEFWSSRLAFVVQMDVLSSGPWKKKISFLECGCNSVSSNASDKFSETWKHLMDLFDDDLYHPGNGIRLRCVIILLRFGTAVIVIPMWLILGFVTVGWMWPPQVRKKLLQQSIIKQKREVSVDLECLTNGIDNVKAKLSEELAESRAMISKMKTDFKSARSDFSDEMNDIKLILYQLSELHGSNRSN